MLCGVLCVIPETHPFPTLQGALFPPALFQAVFLLYDIPVCLPLVFKLSMFQWCALVVGCGAWKAQRNSGQAQTTGKWNGGGCCVRAQVGCHGRANGSRAASTEAAATAWQNQAQVCWFPLRRRHAGTSSPASAQALHGREASATIGCCSFVRSCACSEARWVKGSLRRPWPAPRRCPHPLPRVSARSAPSLLTALIQMASSRRAPGPGAAMVGRVGREFCAGWLPWLLCVICLL